MTKTPIVVALLATLVAGNALAGRHAGEQKFNDLDTDGDGRLSAAELEQAPVRGGRSNEERFARLDADDDDYVSQDEMRGARERVREHRPEFSDLDTDGDGQLSPVELGELPARRGGSADEHFARLDADDDGDISQDELRARARRGPPPSGR